MGEFKNPEGLRIEIKSKPKITIIAKQSGDMTSFQPHTEGRYSGLITIKDVSSTQLEFNGRVIDWFRQKNGWDCGPCMCLNMQDLLNTKDNSGAVSDVDNFRVWAESHTMMTKTRRVLQNGQVLTSSEKQRYTGDMDSEWLRMEDVRNYVKDYLGLREVPIENTNELNTVVNMYSGNRDMFVWGVSNSHYKGYFLDVRGGVYNVDSFRDGPEAARIDDVSNFVRGSSGICFVALGQESQTR